MAKKNRMIYPPKGTPVVAYEVRPQPKPWDKGVLWKRTAQWMANFEDKSNKSTKIK